MKKPVIALITDFGLKDHYVGVVKEVILGINPDVTIVDISHEVEPFNTEEAAILLQDSYLYAPQGTIFVCVVDPTVGSARRGLCVRTPKSFLVGPDNGILSGILKHEKNVEVRQLQNQKFMMARRSSTFHARDVFAPVAAHLSLRAIFPRLGPPLKEMVKLESLEPQITRDRCKLVGHVVRVDRFGNAATNIDRHVVENEFGKQRRIKVMVKKLQLTNVVSFFTELPKNQTVALWNSSDRLEIVCPCGSAAHKLNLKSGDLVTLVVL